MGIPLTNSTIFFFTKVKNRSFKSGFFVLIAKPNKKSCSFTSGSLNALNDYFFYPLSRKVAVVLFDLSLHILGGDLF